MAEQPELAVPPLEWEPCSWEQEGCSRLKITWPTLPPAATPLGGVSVARDAVGYRVGFIMRWIDNGSESLRSAVWNQLGAPIAAWRGISPGSGDITYCDPTEPIVGDSRVWLGGFAIRESGAITTAYVSAPYAELSTATQTVDYSGGNQGMHGNDDTLALAGMDGNHVTVIDRLSGVAKTFGSSDLQSYHDAYPIGQSVLSGCYLGTTERKACVWDRSTQEFAPLIAPPDDYITNVGSDGVTLAWSRCPKTAPGEWDWTACKLWKSPFAADASDLQPVPLCSAPGLAGWHAPASDGMLVGVADSGIHIYRISDGWRWVLPLPPPPNDIQIELVYVDTEEVWYRYVYGIVRQRLDALGAGAPCPAP